MNAEHKLLRRSVLTGLTCCALAWLQPAFAVETKLRPKNTANAADSKTSALAQLTFAEVQTLVQQKLSKNPYYSAGFLISHSDVEPIFNYLLERGVTIAADHEDLYDGILPDNAPLVRLLKTPKGREFQKKLAGDPAAYHRLERLSWSPDGRKLIEGLLGSKDGVEKFRKLKTAQDVAKASKQLAADSRTADFELPSGRTHTATELLALLEKILASQKQPEEGGAR